MPLTENKLRYRLSTGLVWLLAMGVCMTGLSPVLEALVRDFPWLAAGVLLTLLFSILALSAAFPAWMWEQFCRERELSEAERRAYRAEFARKRAETWCDFPPDEREAL